MSRALGTLAAVGVGLAAAALYSTWMGPSKSEPPATEVTVTELYIYPLKSGKGIRVESVELTSVGFKNDRQWMLINQKGEFMTQRRYPSMSQIEATTNDEGTSLTLSSAGKGSVTAEWRAGQGRQQVDVQVWGSKAKGDIMDEADAWLAKYFGQKCRLLRMPTDAIRSIEEPFDGYETKVVFQDGYPQLVVSEESLALLNSKLDKQIDVRRFRPNIVVRGCAPHEEDTWKTLAAGEMVFKGAKLCARCALPTIDPDCGKLDPDYEPIKTLRTYRKFGDETMFGMNLINMTHGGTLRVGDTLRVEEWHDQPPTMDVVLANATA